MMPRPAMVHFAGAAYLFVLGVACGRSALLPQSPSRTAPSASPSSPKPAPIRITADDLPPTDENQFFYVFPTEADQGVSEQVKSSNGPMTLDVTRNWCIRLKLHPLTRNDRREFVKRVGVKDRFKDYLQLSWSSAPTRGAPNATDQSPSFVIDYDDPRFLEVWKTVVSKWGQKPKVDDLEAFVAGYIDVKTTTRRFDTASEVAKSHSGDCSEHAALLTALMRKSGKAARLVTGLLIIVEEKHVGAFGHAWTEWFDNGEWRIADAAMHPVPGQSADGLRSKRYIPVVRMIDEGPGFSAAMGNVRSIEAVKGVEVHECGQGMR